jgi:hypothetical protein
MNVARAIVWGLIVSMVVTAVGLTTAFVTRQNLTWPGILELSSSPGPRPETEMFVNPLAPVVLALLVAAVLWAVGRMRARSRRS